MFNENDAAAGDVVATFSASDEEDGLLTVAGGQVTFTAGSNDAGYYTFDGENVVLTQDGVDAINAGAILPAVNLTATDSGSLTASDSDTPSYTAQNDAPEATNSALTTAEDIVYTFKPADFNFSDVDSGDTLQAVRIDSLPLDGTLYLNGIAITSAGAEVTIDQINNNELTYLPDPNESGADVFGGTGEGDQQADYASFDFSVSDGTDWSASATITVDVTPVVDAPTLSLNDTSASDGSDLLDQLTVPTAVGMTQTIYSNIGLGGALLESVQLETVSDGLSGGVTNIVTQPYRDGGNDVDNVDEDSIQVTTGIIYLEAGDTLSFNGYNDDALLIEIGGQTLIRTTGDAWGNYDTSYNGTISSTGDGAGTVETYGDFVASVSGYYTFEMYIYNHNGPGDLSVNAVLNGVETAFNTDNFSIYPDMASVDTASGQHSGFVVGPEVGTDGGVYPVEVNSGTEGMAIKLSSVTAALTDLDGSESLALTMSGIPAGATLTDGVNTYTAPVASTGSVDMAGWDLDALSITVANVDATTTYTLQVTAISTEDATGDSASVQLPLQVTVYDSTTPTLYDNSADVYEAAMATGTDSSSTAEVATGNVLADDTLPNGASLTNVTIAGGTTDSGVAGQITVTTAEGNTLVVDTATGDYTYTLINAVDHYIITEIPGTQISDSSTIGTLDSGDSYVHTYDYGTGHANQTVTITFDVAVNDVWLSNSGWDEGKDELSIVANSVSRIMNDDGSVTMDVQLDSQGRLQLEMVNNANQSGETATITNFAITGSDNEVTYALSDTLVDSFTYTVQNSDGMTYDASLDVTIHDDAPAVDSTASVTLSLPEPSDTNILLTLDVSGSMSTTVNGISRFEIAKAALVNTINAYSDQGEVNVNLTLFNTNALNMGWMTSTEALAYLNDLSMDGMTIEYMGIPISELSSVYTNYEAAIDVTPSTYDTNLPAADKTVAYFISDGDPTREYDDTTSDPTDTTSSDGIDGGYVDTIYLSAWDSFINTNEIKLEVIGIGTALNESYLNMVQVVDGKSAVIVSDETQLSDTILSTIESVEGSLYGSEGAAGIIFGADGGHILELTYEGTTYTYDANTPVQSIALTEGTMDLDFETGDFIYTPTVSSGNDIVENFVISVTDDDGDSVLNQNLSLTIGIDETLVYDGSALDGGAGFDTMTLATDADLDFSGISNIANIEKIDLSVTGDHQLLNLNAQDVLDMTDADHELFIDGETGDRVTIDSTLFHKTAADGSNETMAMNGHVYDVYTDGSNSLTLNIEQGIQVDPS